jgi:hypothetical protein
MNNGGWDGGAGAGAGAGGQIEGFRLEDGTGQLAWSGLEAISNPDQILIGFHRDFSHSRKTNDLNYQKESLQLDLSTTRTTTDGQRQR